MRKVYYIVDSDGHQARSLLALRWHIESYNCRYKCNDYDGSYVYRYYLRSGTLVSDDTFIRQINVVNGKVIFRRVAVPPLPF